MAIAYAWDLGGGHYGYIVDPTDEKKPMVTDSPISGSDLNRVSSWADNLDMSKKEDKDKYVGNFNALKVMAFNSGFAVNFNDVAEYANVSDNCSELKGAQGPMGPEGPAGPQGPPGPSGEIDLSQLDAKYLKLEGGGTVNGDVSANAFYETSDERIKDVQRDLEVDLDKLKKIPKVYFKYKGGNGDMNIGTLAQSLSEIYPELVSETKDGTFTVDYSKLSVIALAAVDRLYEEINMLKERLGI